MNNQDLSVLMIDDNPADCELVRTLLDKAEAPWKIEFKDAGTLNEALDKLERRAFDLLIVDYHFPFGTGFDLLQSLRQNGYDIPSIMLTGQGDEEVAGEAVQKNLNDYLPKDQLTSNRLRQSIEQILDPLSGLGNAKSPTSKPTSSRNHSAFQPIASYFNRLADQLREATDHRLLLSKLHLRNSQPDPVPWNHIMNAYTRILHQYLPNKVTLFRIHNNVLSALISQSLLGQTKQDSFLNELLENVRDDIFGDKPGPEVYNAREAMVLGWLQFNNIQAYVDPAHLLNDALDHFEPMKWEESIASGTIELSPSKGVQG